VVRGALIGHEHHGGSGDQARLRNDLLIESHSGASGRRLE